MADWKIPFGRARGETLESTEKSNITWAIDAVEKKLEAEPNGQFADLNRKWLKAARAELDRRAAGGTVLAKPQAAPIARVAPPPMLGASMNDPVAVSGHLAKLSESHHIVSPATTVDCLPPGCGVAVNYVLVNADTKSSGPGEVYALSGGKVGLSGTTLAKIGAAAGVDWDASQSGRLDNGSDPHYVHFRAVGHVRNLDGSVRTLTGEVEIDARENSPQLDEIRQKAIQRAADQNKTNDGGAAQVLELRKFILRHAETKAKSRAIAAMGLKRSYSADELKKPFAVCRLMWTGQTDNPELARVFAEKTADAMIGGMASLYGRPAPQPAPAPHVALPAPQRFETQGVPAFTGHGPPPSPRTVIEAEELGDYGDFGGGDDEPESEHPKTAAKPGPKQPAVEGDGVDPRY